MKKARYTVYFILKLGKLLTRIEIFNFGYLQGREMLRVSHAEIVRQRFTCPAGANARQVCHPCAAKNSNYCNYYCSHGNKIVCVNNIDNYAELCIPP